MHARVAPRWWVALCVYVGYNAIVFATWGAVGADYRDLVSADVVASRLVLPLALGAVFVVAAVSWLGWWRPVLVERERSTLRWPFVLVLVAFLGFVAVNAVALRWSALSPSHLLLLVAGSVLVGFNEEAVTRGVLVTGLRGSTSSETRVWLWSSLLFGAMHIPNALFGLPLAGALVQFVFATLMGGAFYVLRRTGGSIVMPMVLHGAWDFTSFGSTVVGPASALSPVFQFGTYAAAIVGVVAVLRHERRTRATATTAPR